MANQTPGKTAAFFDLDGTLIPGSANIPLAKAAFREGLVTPAELLRDLRHGISFLLRGATDKRSEEVRERILRAVKGHPARDVEALGRHFIGALAASVRPEMLKVLDLHKGRGEDRIVLSASPTEIVSRFAEVLGMELGTGTTAERDEAGLFTGRLAGPFCYRDGKVEVMNGLANDNGYDLSRCFAYSDSMSDVPMLEAVGHPVVVNPEPELRQLAISRNWPIIETSSVPRVPLTSVLGLARLTGGLARSAAKKTAAQVSKTASASSAQARTARRVRGRTVAFERRG
ncbi:MAG: HAD-IB family hydrolase [Candidatus Nanopelagicales bacterium]|nr:HAD-IB family hydrolase [Candidatus Nanopelagicales bacterium]MDZ4250237.1 HAD-IB family hydrolase [Candidatus Nanopelagicales bacterium]